VVASVSAVVGLSVVVASVTDEVEGADASVVLLPAGTALSSAAQAAVDSASARTR
jgi:hypothetical protein